MIDDAINQTARRVERVDCKERNAPATRERPGARHGGISSMPDEAYIPGSTACVLHAGHLDRKGYGKVKADGRMTSAHRAAWAAVHGPVPHGLELHHVCENKACVNVAHLLPMTPKQHHALHLPTHCHNGHPFDAENTYVEARLGGRRRHCRACRRAAVVRYRKAMEERAR